jgi:hypothetical protein
MLTIKKTDVDSFLKIIEGEKNQQVKTKLEQWISVYGAHNNELANTNDLIGIANSSSQKKAIVDWANGLK